MTYKEQKKAAKEFYEEWKDKGEENKYTQAFWNSMLRDVFGIPKPETTYIDYQKTVYINGTPHWIDGYIKNTHVIIEQKSSDKNLITHKEKHGDLNLNAFEQARWYDGNLYYGEHCQWIVTCNFKEIYIYDMREVHKDSTPTYSFSLSDFDKEFTSLDFLISQRDVNLVKEEKVSKEAGDLVGKLYDALLKQYNNPKDKDTLKSLNVLCVRLVFCLYAEDAGLFETPTAFHDYLDSYNTPHIRTGLIELFKTLKTKIEDRSLNIGEELKNFPYVNGGLFENLDYEIPQFNDEIRHILLDEASAGFDWSEISPTVFGACFESTLNQDTRRKLGMHYTPVENIHKVIDPLFLNELEDELEEILQIDNTKSKKSRLLKYQDKLASLKWFDPACGSGNFLTETYLNIRKLENRTIDAYYSISIKNHQKGQQIIIDKTIRKNPIKVSIEQFYGIELNHFAVTVAKTALWIAESQMMQETEKMLLMELKFFPLQTQAHIDQNNALRIDWNEVCPMNKINYIMGNPPFKGKKDQSKDQKADMKYVFGKKFKGLGNLDYVSAWYKKAMDYIVDTNIKVAFVSTNSVVQGEHIPILWKKLYEQYPINIYFAHTSFKWESETKNKANVHCVIIGFSSSKEKNKVIYTPEKTNVNEIHPYLLDMPLSFIDYRNTPICIVKPLVYGSFILDDGNYTISEEEYLNIIKKEPAIKKYFKLFLGSEEFINDKKRYCVWLKNGDLSEIRHSNILMKKIENVRNWRKSSTRSATAKMAETPMLFAEDRQPDADYLAIPITSSERRDYIPMGYMKKDIIASNHLLVLPNATLYDFGILTSIVHMAWMRIVAGRMKSDYNYSSKVVYNNFPWPSPTKDQKRKIEETAQGILDARDLYPNSSLADLYDPIVMPPELLKAHQANDKAVKELYGFDDKEISDLDYVIALMDMYKDIISKK